MKIHVITILMLLVLGVLLAGCGEGWTGKVIEPVPLLGPEIATDAEEAEVPASIEEETVEADTEPEEMPEAMPGLEQTPEVRPDDFDGIVLTYTEGDMIELDPVAIDEDGDRVTYTFPEPFTKDGKWQTKIGDEGKHLIKEIASDGKSETEQTILIIINRANREPVISCKDQAVLKEGERFYVGDYCEIYDADDEEVVVQYSGWPGRSRYVTTYDDAGEHTLLITANDKQHITQHQLTIVVRDVNRKPVMGELPTRIVGMEGDVLTIDISGAEDPDGDSVSFTFSEPFGKNGIWRTEVGDAGAYDIDVVASDGKESVKRTVLVDLKLANTKPMLRPIADIVVDETETIELPISATDREGDDLVVTVTGWMNSDTYTTTYDDAGEYTVKVTASDGQLETSQIVHITVNDVNRPPYFVKPA